MYRVWGGEIPGGGATAQQRENTRIRKGEMGTVGKDLLNNESWEKNFETSTSQLYRVMQQVAFVIFLSN